MNFPDGINGPGISNGDLVNFHFPNSSLTIRIPKIPFNNDTTDRIATIDWTNPDYHNWTSINIGKTNELVYQSWHYEDKNTHDDVALCFLEMHIIKLDGIDYSQPVTLNNLTFRQHVLEELSVDEEDWDNDIDIGIKPKEGWPTQENEFFLDNVTKPVLNGLKFLLGLDAKQSPYPTPVAVFVLDSDINLSVALTLESLHYTDRKNPFSEEILHQFKMDLFEEILANIHIEYSPELLAQIEALK